jgi:hypothetical protein
MTAMSRGSELVTTVRVDSPPRRAQQQIDLSFVPESILPSLLPRASKNISYDQFLQKFFKVDNKQRLRPNQGEADHMISNGGNLVRSTFASISSNPELFSSATVIPWTQFLTDFVSGDSALHWQDDKTLNNDPLEIAVHQVAMQQATDENTAAAMLHKLVDAIVLKQSSETIDRRQGDSINLKAKLKQAGFDKLTSEQKYFIVDALLRTYILNENGEQKQAEDASVTRFVKLINQLKSISTTPSPEIELPAVAPIPFDPAISSQGTSLVQETIDATPNETVDLEKMILSLTGQSEHDWDTLVGHSGRETLSPQDAADHYRRVAINDKFVNSRGSKPIMQNALEILAQAYRLTETYGSFSKTKREALAEIREEMMNIALTKLTEVY